MKYYKNLFTSIIIHIHQIQTIYLVRFEVLMACSLIWPVALFKFFLFKAVKVTSNMLTDQFSFVAYMEFQILEVP